MRTKCATMGCERDAIIVERRQTVQMSAPGFYGACSDHMEHGTTTCPHCPAPAAYQGLIAIDVGQGVEAWRYDCAEGHTSLVIFTEEIPDEEEED